MFTARRRTIATSSGALRMRALPASCASIIASPPSIRFRRRWTMPSAPIAGCWPKAPIRGGWPSWAIPPAAASPIGMLLKLRDLGVPLPAAAVALSPWTDLALTGESLRLSSAADPMLSTAQARAFRRQLSRRRRSQNALRLAALRRSGGTAALADPGRQRRNPARRCGLHGRAAAGRRLQCRARSLAAHAACLAIVCAHPAGGPAGDRTDRRLCAAKARRQLTAMQAAASGPQRTLALRLSALKLRSHELR